MSQNGFHIILGHWFMLMGTMFVCSTTLLFIYTDNYTRPWSNRGRQQKEMKTILRILEDQLYVRLVVDDFCSIWEHSTRRSKLKGSDPDYVKRDYPAAVLRN